MPTSAAVSLDLQDGRWGRETVTGLLSAFARAQAATGMSQRAFAEAEGVPRTTLQHWLHRQEALDLPPEVVAFFESPAGFAFLHRLVVAAHLVMTWMGTCGIRLVGEFIALAGLKPVLARSYGVHQQLSVQIQQALVAYGQQERARLGAAMPQREITVVADETFLSSGVCLVAIEPVSGFVVVEEYAERRDAETWNTVMHAATRDLKVVVVQSTADEGQALARHAQALGAQHSPDLFHVQNEVNQAFVLPLLRRRRHAEEGFAEATQTVQHRRDERDTSRSRPRGPGRPPHFDARICAAEEVQAAALAALQVEEVRWQGWLTAVRSLALVYHPYDLTSGAPRSPEQLGVELSEQFGLLRASAHDADLSASSHAGIEKAARVVPKMVDTLRFFHEQVHLRLKALELPTDVEATLRTVLIPAAYLSRVLAREDDKSRRASLRETLERLLAPVRAPEGPLCALDEEAHRRLEQAAFGCADLFQRASSCVEGRNGRLSQWEHAQRRVSAQKLAGITIVHNYVIQRACGTTAAERFFGSKPRDLFSWLLEHVRPTPRPASPRPANPIATLLGPPTGSPSWPRG